MILLTFNVWCGCERLIGVVHHSHDMLGVHSLKQGHLHSDGSSQYPLWSQGVGGVLI